MRLRRFSCQSHDSISSLSAPSFIHVSFVDDGTQSTETGSAAPGSTPRSGSKKRRPAMMSVYQMSLMSQDDNPIFRDRPRYAGNKHKMVFGKMTPSPTSSLDDDGAVQYDNP